MKKVLGLTLALTLTVAASAAAEEMRSTVKSIDSMNQSFTLEDGTQLSLSGYGLTQLSPGDQVLAAHEMKDGKKVVTGVTRDRAFDIQSASE